MGKTVLTALLLTAAAFAGAQEILKLSGKPGEIPVSGLAANSDGSISYLTGPGEVRNTVRRGGYDYAWIPKPKEVADADRELTSGSPARAGILYKKAYDKYKLLGWDIYCIMKDAEAMAASGQKKEACAKLDQLRDYRLLNPKLEPQLAEANRLNVSIRISGGDFDGAQTILESMMRGHDEDSAIFAFLRRGDILSKQGKSRDAALLYVQAALLFPDNPVRPEALLKTARTLEELGDARSATFAGMLRKEYPESPEAKQLTKQQKQ